MLGWPLGRVGLTNACRQLLLALAYGTVVFLFVSA
jgi:hypothetical protein